jgi:adhesin/invasin
VTVTPSGGCTIAGSTVTMTSGTAACVLTASQAGSADYSAASDVVHTVTAAKAGQTITFTPPASPATFGATFLVAPTTTSGLTVTVTPSGGCTIAGSTVTMTSGTTDCVLTASQAGSADYSAASDVVHTVVATLRPASVTPDDATKASGDPDPAFTGTLTGFLTADNVTATYARPAGETVGPYTISATLSAAGGAGVLANYSLTYNTGTLTVIPGAASAAQATASVPAGTAGSATTITVTVRDANGNVRAATDDSGLLAVSISGANTATPTVVSAGSGTYTASYTPTAVGTDDVAITLSAVAIGGGPYTSVVGAGALHHFLVEANGGGTIGSQTAGVPFSVQITAQDANDNTVTGFTGAGNTADISSTGTQSAGGGTTATFTAGLLTAHSVAISNTGAFTLTATRTGGSEAGTSGSFAVNPGPVDTTTSIVTVSSGAVALFGTVTITLQARDSLGNNLTAGGRTVTFDLSNPFAGTLSGVTDKGDGTYAATFTGALSGQSTDVSATIDGTQVTTAKPTITVTP